MPVLPSGVVASQGWGVGSAVPAPLLGHSRTFPAQLWELSSAQLCASLGTSWEGMWPEKYQHATSKSTSLGSGV